MAGQVLLDCMCQFELGGFTTISLSTTIDEWLGYQNDEGK